MRKNLYRDISPSVASGWLLVIEALLKHNWKKLKEAMERLEEELSGIIDI